jgi:hypothetical protein
MHVFKTIGLTVGIIGMAASSCAFVGTTSLGCYSKLHLSGPKTAVILNQFWHRYPENRICDSLVDKIGKQSDIKVDLILSKYAASCTSCKCIFKVQSKTESYQKTSWWIRSSNGEMVFEVSVANKNSWLNGFTSDLCLETVLFTDDLAKNFRNWNLTREQKRWVRRLFQTDILPKLEYCKWGI